MRCKELVFGRVAYRVVQRMVVKSKRATVAALEVLGLEGCVRTTRVPDKELMKGLDPADPGEGGGRGEDGGPAERGAEYGESERGEGGCMMAGSKWMERVMGRMAVEDLPESYRDVAMTVGVENAVRLSELLGGLSFYFQRLDRVLAGKRDEMIRSEFDGANHRVLAKEYGLSEGVD